MGGLFNSGQSSTQSSQQTSRPIFGTEGQQVLESLMGAITPGQAPSGPGADFFASVLAQRPGQVNPYTSQLIQQNRAMADRDLQDQLARGRSQLQGTPLGRSQLALDDTIARNRLALNEFTTQQLAGQSNLDLGRQMEAASALANLGQGQTQSGLNLLQLLRGEQTNAHSQSEQTSSQSPFSSLMQLGGLAAGLMTGGAALPALASTGSLGGQRMR